MGLCFVAVLVAASIKFLLWCINNYPLTTIVAVVVIVAAWAWCEYEDYKRRTG